MRRVTAPLLVVAVLVAALLVGSAPASAQYEAETGDLEFSLSLLVELFGDGFAPDSMVLLTLSQEGSDGALDLGSVEADADGAVETTITLPDGLTSGTYELNATGVTEDGATRILTARFNIGGGEPPDETTTTTTSTTTTTIPEDDTTTTSGELPQEVVDALLAGLQSVRNIAS